MQPSVSLIRAQSYERQVLRDALETLLQPLGGMAALVKPGDRVLLKPNLLTAARPGKECTTRAELVYCVAQMVQAAGGQPFLGDSPAFGSAKGVAVANGYLPVIEELNLPIVDFHGKRYQTAGDTFNHLLLCKEAMEADVVINLPKVKSHSQLTLTLGVKNLFGCVPGKMKAFWHMEAGKDRDRFGQMLVETARAIISIPDRDSYRTAPAPTDNIPHSRDRGVEDPNENRYNPNLTILDGIIGHEGNGPSGGEPRHLGILGASQDVFALDRAVVEILNVDPLAVPTVAAAIRLGLCSNLEAIDFPQLRPEDLKVLDWKLPDTLMPIDFGMPRVIKSTFKHLYIRLIKEPMTAYAGR